MSIRDLTDVEFISEFHRIGPSGLAARFNCDPRRVRERRAEIEAANGIKLIAQNAPIHINENAHSRRHHMTVDDGIVIVFSDAHYWPGIISTAHRALIKACKEFGSTLKGVICNGDAFDGASISRFPVQQWLDADKRPSVKEELDACKDRLTEIELACRRGVDLSWNLGNHDCLDTDTECLTRRGWVRYDEILKNDMVLSLNNGVAEWSNINEILTYQFSGELVRIEKRDISMAVTKNHRVLINALDWRTHQYTVRKFVSADNLPASFTMPMSAESRHVGVGLSDDELSFAGWFLTDGGFDASGGMTIWQSKPEGRKEIVRILAALGVKYREDIRNRNPGHICGRKLVKTPMEQHSFRLNAESSRIMSKIVPNKGVLPDWANDLSGRQFSVLLDAIVGGDGTWDGKDAAKKNVASLYGTYEFLSSVQSVSVQHGWRTRLAQDNRGNFVLRLCKSEKLRIGGSGRDVFHDQYNGEIWCLRVPHGNFMVRRNGSAYFTGNSRYEAKLASSVPEFSKCSGFHLKDHFPKWTPAWSTWINEDVICKHRYKGGIHATHNNTVNSGKTIVTGHLHSLKVTPFTDYNSTRWGVDTGTLADPTGPQFDYAEDNPMNHRSGFVVLTFHKGRLLWPEICAVIDDNHVEFRGKVWAV